ncbi:MAG: alpha/beta hydrolase [Acidimicrobiia bacterium]|nr:alpha/beta hydrolase [Acidimicrobiia bacterium]
MPTFESFDGVTLHYEEEGDGDVVVLLHGFAADTNINWIRPGIFDALCDEGYRVVTLDARGHGLSGKPHDDGAYAGGAMVRDVQALLDEIGCDACSVVGFSMGSATTMHLAVVEPRVRSAALLGVGAVTLVAGGERRDFLVDAMTAEDPASLSDPIAAEFRRLADSVRADRLALAAWARATGDDAAPALGRSRSRSSSSPDATTSWPVRPRASRSGSPERRPSACPATTSPRTTNPLSTPRSSSSSRPRGSCLDRG